MCIGSFKQQIALLASYLDSVDSTFCEKGRTTQQTSLSLSRARSRHRPQWLLCLGMRDLKRAGTGLCTKEEQVLELTHTENKIHTFQALVSALARCCGRAQEPMLRPPAAAAAEMWSPAATCLLQKSGWTILSQLKSTAKRPSASGT